jgi:hypothetical protein
MKGNVLRVVSGGAVVAVLMTVMVMPASAAVTPVTAPTVSVANPLPGSYMRRGSTWVTGVACDPNAAASDTTAGIASVRVFAGDRDDPTNTWNKRPGGYLGGATLAGTLGTGSGVDFSVNAAENSRLGLGNPAVNICKNPNAGWRVLTAAITRKDAFDLNVYVLAKNGAETKVTLGGIRFDLP